LEPDIFTISSTGGKDFAQRIEVVFHL